MKRGEAADYAGISTRTIDKWRLDGLPFSLVGGTIFIHRDDLDKYIRSHAARTFARRHGYAV
jgi:excisionase family DNA binding protein